MEQENEFCRTQLSQVLEKAKSVFETSQESDGITKVEMFVSGLQAISEELGQKENIQTELDRCKRELEEFRKQLASANFEQSSDEIEDLKQQLQTLKVREEEAVTQVSKSLQVAEQMRSEKAETQFEVNQLSAQVDRQQQRIRNLIEEQVMKVEEERTMIEARCKGELENLRKELNTKVNNSCHNF